jgi:hypothetical protein
LTTAKFVGSWNAVDSCETNTYGYTITIAASSSVVNQLLITNFGEYGTSFVVKADISGMSFTVPLQLVEGITISGSGEIDAFQNTMTVNYTAENQAHQTDACSGTWIKVQ